MGRGREPAMNTDVLCSVRVSGGLVLTMRDLPLTHTLSSLAYLTWVAHPLTCLERHLPWLRFLPLWTGAAESSTSERPRPDAAVAPGRPPRQPVRAGERASADRDSLLSKIVGVDAFHLVRGGGG